MDEEKRITLRMPPELHALVTAQAERERRSLNSEILCRLEAAYAGIGTANGESP